MRDEVEIKGWDFSALFKSGRMKETPLPWDYAQVVKQHIPQADLMLDMGTGGGEFLSSLAPLPRKTYATEGYEPNIKIAEENLASYKVKVISGYKDNSLPFENNFFDLIINRHEFYDPREVYRILKPNGKFITQQAAGNCDIDIIKLFERKLPDEYKDWSLSAAVDGLRSAGFTINESNKAAGHTLFYDTGALISYIKVINWLIPDFTIEKYSSSIDEAKHIIRQNGDFRSTLDRFLIISNKPV